MMNLTELGKKIEDRLDLESRVSAEKFSVIFRKFDKLEKSTENASLERSSILIQVTRMVEKISNLDKETIDNKTRITALEADQKVALQTRGRMSVIYTVLIGLALIVFKNALIATGLLK
jgi:tetrahydromethanopterin S-methyltransferase subunit G